MINHSIIVPTEDPIKYVWNTLRYFIDINFSIEKIINIHDIKDKKSNDNIKKQAKQIGYCIRQAEEYFTASSYVDLPTRPLLLYYGIVNLSQALVLLRQNGDFSLDVLRKNNNHKHHGLEILGSFKSNVDARDKIEPFLSSIQCICHLKDDKCWGQFPNFYNSLEPCATNIKTQYYDDVRKSFLRTNPFETARKIEMNVISKKTFNVFDIIKTLPDLYNLLCLNQITPDLCRGQAEAVHKTLYKKGSNDDQEISKTVLEFYYTIDFILSEQKESFVCFLKEHCQNIEFTREYNNSFSFQQILEFNEQEGATFSAPDIAESIFGDLYFIIYPNEYIPEPAAHFIILYCLGMLSRYYPDIWLKAIDENVILREVIDNLLDIIYRKFPYLILDQMTGTHYICRR